jgi:hypothetical protein
VLRYTVTRTVTKLLTVDALNGQLIRFVLDIFLGTTLEMEVLDETDKIGCGAPRQISSGIAIARLRRQWPWKTVE